MQQRKEKATEKFSYQRKQKLLTKRHASKKQNTADMCQKYIYIYIYITEIYN